MSSAAASVPVSTLDDDAWEDLLSFKGAALLREAAGLVDGLPPTLRALHDVRLWRDLILTAPASAERSAG